MFCLCIIAFISIYNLDKGDDNTVLVIDTVVEGLNLQQDDMIETEVHIDIESLPNIETYLIEEKVVNELEIPIKEIEDTMDVEMSDKPITEEIEENSNILFVGNSLVSGLEMVSKDENDFIAEIGLSLNKLKKEYFDDISKYSCDIVVIGMGTNELGGYTEVGFKNYYMDLIEHIRKINPNSVIYSLSIPPVSEKKSNNDELFNNTNVVLYNSYIREICEGSNIIFIDNTEYFGVVLESDWTPDGIHLYGAIYKEWYNFILNKI